jgi:ATP-dependent DNA helicase PIF1
MTDMEFPPAFVRLLNELRLGKVTEESCAMFKSLQRKVQYTDNIEPTVLHPKRASVLEENSRRLRALKTESLKFVANDTSGHRKEDGQPCFPDAARLKQVLDSSTLIEAAMELKVNCQVMLVKVRSSR